MNKIRKLNIILVVLGLVPFCLGSQDNPVASNISALARLRYKVEKVSYASPVLSQFWNRAMSIEANIILPLSYDSSGEKKFPVVFHFHGLGGSEKEALKWADGIHATETKHEELQMIHVFMRTSFSVAYHSFIDSNCTGPWGSAFISEFIPALSKDYRISSEAKSRFLTGHSSGAWTAIWLQINYPNLFGGVWASAPDPLDFRSFYGINLSPDTSDNVYQDSAGNLRPYSRANSVSLKEMVQPAQGKNNIDTEFDSDEWKWSPCTEKKQPMQLFNRQSGEINRNVLVAWEKYDLRKVVENNWEEDRNNLHGKFHIVCGEQDTFFLEFPTRLFCEALKTLGESDACLFIPERNHLNLYSPAKEYPEGLFVRFLKEMAENR